MIDLRILNGESDRALIQIDVCDRILAAPIVHSTIGDLSPANVALTAYGLEASHFRFRSHKSLQKAVRASLLPDVCVLLFLNNSVFVVWEGHTNSQYGGTPNSRKLLTIFDVRGFMDVCETLSR